MTSGEKQAFTLRISQANPTEMVVVLYDMLLCYLKDGQAALEQKNDMELQAAVRRARGCIGELLNSLNLKYEQAQVLHRLYGFCIRKLASAEAGRRALPLEEIEQIIVPLRNAYAQIAAQNSAGPVMNNSQTVYVGLTYGRNSLTENMTDQGANRGMFA